MRVLISGWVGSTNLGDELVLAGVRRLFGPHTRLCAVSLDPRATRRDHGIAAIDHRRLDLLVRATAQADLVVLGGGGLIQDETSPLNLPYHLSRVWLAELARTPYIGLALGVGPVTTAAGRRLATTLRHARSVSVRDPASADLLAEFGVDATLSADAAHHLPVATNGAERPSSGDPGHEAQVEGECCRGPARPIVVSLRPWSRDGGRWLPVGWRSGGGEPDWLVPTVAAALDRASERTGAPIRFVALQTDRDHRLHQRVAAAMRTPTELRVPTRARVLGELGAGRVVVAMRYHAGVGATLAGRPSVLIGYSPKVDALAAELGTGAAHRPFCRAALADLDDAIVAQFDSVTAEADVAAGAEALHRRAQRDTATISALGG